MRSWVAVAGIAGIAVALVGCGSDRVNAHHSPAGSAAVGTKSPAPVVVATASPSPSAMPGTPLARPAGGPSWTELGSSPRCRTTGLGISFGYSERAAGHRYTPLVFTNKTGHVCHLQGYPGVSVLDADKTQLGPAASYDGGNLHRRLELRSGAAASTVLHWTSDAAGMCRPESTYLRVYPPGDTVPIVVPARIQICANFFSVRNLTTGASGG